MQQRRFRQVDVFTAEPYKGNPVAVVLDGDGLETAQMQAIARWTNLSETTFVCSPEHPDADYRLRIFNPANEMRFAGHPTIGSAHAMLSSGFIPKRDGALVQECGVGLVQMRIDDTGIRIALPRAQFKTVDKETRALVEEALGASLVEDPVVVDLGVAWLTGQVASGELLRSLRPDMNRIGMATTRAVASGLNIFGLDEATVEVRSFAPTEGTPEDPVCGSGNGAVAYYLRERRGPVDYRARQGRCIGSDGQIEITYENDVIWLGGLAVNCIEGYISA
ncbi:PhzF family phenazine biosynthesis protein [Noviherbaspirillum sp. ST9]|uniref:PhzF family phenazine biosynthesis protein n=1 Tax=Noviherbaspirillum sp. ST9 TaxID=3401606 RepID=UPI003B5866F9